MRLAAAGRRLAARFGQEDQGMVAVVVALVMVAMLGFVALVLDTGVLFVHRTQLQKAVDAAALAGARDLWPNGSGMAADAAAYAAKNGVDPTADANTTLTYNANPPDNNTWNPRSEAWMVTASRKVPLVFAPVLGIPQATVTATAVAINSPLLSIDMPYVLPYAIWGGNNVTGSSGPNGPCCDPLTLPVPSSFTIYDWQRLTGGSPASSVVYRDNQWANAVVYPTSQCGGNNQPPCNQNWVVGPQVGFKGFFNNLVGPNLSLVAGSLNVGLASQSGNASESDAQSMICQTLSKNPQQPVAIMPVVDWSQENSGVLSFWIPYFVGIKLDAISGCSSGNALGTHYTGTALSQWLSAVGKGHGPSTSPVHVLQLWQ